MNLFGHLTAVLGCMLAVALLPSGQTSDGKGANATGQDLPTGAGRELVLKQCTGCHQITVVTSQRKSESAWTDTIVEMRNRGANGSDEEMEQIIHYLAANFGPANATAKVNVNSASAAEMVAGLGLTQAAADAIVAYRGKNGKFKDIASVKQVPGVDAAKIDAAKSRIEF